MEIKISDKYMLKTIDKHNWVLMKKMVEKEEGKRKGDGWKNVSYYARLGQAFAGVLDSPEVMLDMKTKEEHMEWLTKIENLYNQFQNGTRSE